MANIALVDDDTLYFRVDDTTRPDFVAREMSPLRPVRRDPSKVSLNYYQCPADILDDADELVVWARRALRAATSPTAAVAKRARKPQSHAAGPSKRKRAAKRKPARSR